MGPPPKKEFLRTLPRSMGGEGRAPGEDYDAPDVLGDRVKDDIKKGLATAEAASRLPEPPDLADKSIEIARMRARSMAKGGIGSTFRTGARGVTAPPPISKLSLYGS